MSCVGGKLPRFSSICNEGVFISSPIYQLSSSRPQIEAPPAIVWEAGEPHKSCPGEQGSTLHIRPLSAAKRKDGEGSPVPEINLVPLLPGMWLGFSPPG